MQETIKNINRSEKLPLGKLPLGNILYLSLTRLLSRSGCRSSGNRLKNQASISQSLLPVRCAIQWNVIHGTSNNYAISSGMQRRERKGELIFVDPVYRLWFSQEY